MTNVTPLGAPRAVIEQLSEQIYALFEEYNGRVSVAELIGILELIKIDIIRDHHD